MSSAASLKAAHAARPGLGVVLDPGRSATQARDLQAVARRGLTGPARPYPHSARIQAAFGRYAPEGLSAHIGPAARAASDRLSAHGFVLGGRVAFGGTPSLHTAAHEAAHKVAQDRGGVGARFGVGVQGDASEAFADRVADAVVAGRSAEGLLAAAPGGVGGGGGPILQMQNKITDNGGKSRYTPWKQIDNQLPLKPTFDLDAHIKMVEPGFASMIDTLGDDCLRATYVEASIQGKATSKGRKADKLQTAYGTIGTFEEFITGAPTLQNYEFNGGHLISDLILGKDSYVEGNFAPQRRYLNSPIFRKIEEIGEGGLTYVGPSKSKPKKTPPHKMTTWVEYPSKTHKTPSADIIDTLQIPAKQLTKKPPTDIELNTWVPDLWQTKVEAPKNYEMAHQSTLDTTDSARDGFLQDEKSVVKARKNTTTHVDSNRWAMDTMTLLNPFSNSGKGLMTTQSKLHSFTAIQSAPRRGMKKLNSKTVTVAPTKTLAIPIVPTTITLDDVVASNLTGLKRLVKEFVDQTHVNPAKRQKIDLAQTDLEDSLRTIQHLMQTNPTTFNFNPGDLKFSEGVAVKKGRKQTKEKRRALGLSHQVLTGSLLAGKKRKFI